MSKLIIYNENGVLEGERVIDRERLKIGRKAHNDLRLPHAAVSGDHALLITVRMDTFVEDLNSTNGVRVNNKLVDKCLLQDGDELTIGRYRLRFVLERHPRFSPPENSGLLEFFEPPAATAVASWNTVDVDYPTPVAQTQKMTDGAVLAVPRVESPRGPYEIKSADTTSVQQAGIQILSGPGAGKEVNLAKALTTIGKPGVQVAVITRRTQGYFLTHIEGGDFPLVNGAPVGPHSRPLSNHDIIELAGTKLEFFYR